MGDESVSRTKDGVPTFDGTADKLNLYREEALQYLFTLEHHKRYLAGPRLAQALTGIARTVIRKRLAGDPQWLAHPRGGYDLLEHLERCIGQPSLLQASQHIQKFFYQLKRKRFESMTAWTNRHSEALWEASRALRLVQSDLGTSVSTGRGMSEPSSGRSSTDWRNYKRDRPRQAQSSDDQGPFGDNGRLREEEDEWGAADEGVHSDAGWSWKSSDWADWYWGSWKSDEYAPPASWSAEAPDFIPDHLTGFLLLQRSGLDAGERANVLAAIKGNISVVSVEQALKEQWTDEDLMKRDKQYHQAQLVLEDEPEDVMLADEGAPDPHEDAEAYECYMADQALIESALEVIQEKKRTLKEARWRQQQVRMGRNFYPTGKGKSSWPRSSTFHQGPKGGKGDSTIKCVRCGGPHQTVNCPVPKKQHAQVSEETEVAFGSELLQNSPAEAVHVSAEVGNNIMQCKGVIDCGATATLGSIAAVEALMHNNMTKHGEDRVTIDPHNTPVFKFGNNGTTSCVSTAHLKVDCGSKLGAMAVHVHEVPNQPILISVKALKSLGAVVDFARDEVIYKHLCPHSVVSLESAKNGHLLMPLGGNLLAGAVKRAQPFSQLGDE